MPAADRNLIRAINRFKVLHSIRDHRLISRVAISRDTGLSQASVTGITAELIKEGLLFEKEAGESIGGRRPIMLALNPEGAYTVGVFMSVRQISVVIINLQADVIASYELLLEEEHYTPEQLADRIIQAVHSCIWEADFSKNQLSGVGIAIPGLVDSETGVVRFLPNYGWENINFRDIIYEKIKIPTYIENSANTLTLAEQWFGEGRGLDNFLTVNLAHGIGMGIVINGQLYRGSNGMAGEFGHITIDTNGPLCRCGKQGCLEAYAGNIAILKSGKALAEAGQWTPDNPEEISIEEILQKAQEGVSPLRELYRTAGEVLGLGLTNLIEIFNPIRIIVMGKGVTAGELILNPMRETLDHQMTGRGKARVELVIRDWSPTDNARGAGSLVLQEIYRSPANRIVPVI